MPAVSARILPWLLIPLAALAGYLAGASTNDGAAGTARPDAETDVAAPDTSSPDGVRPGGAGAVEPRGRPRAGSPPAGPAAPPLRVVGDPSERAEDVLARLEPTPLAITGIVQTPEGTPLAGVLVRAESDLPREFLGSLGDDLDDGDVATPRIDVALREYLDPGSLTADDVERHRLELLLRREVRTGADGTFRIDGLRLIDYDVEAKLAGWEIDTEDYSDSNDIRGGAEIKFTATRLVNVTVDIVGADGQPVAKAAVFCSETDDDPLEYEYLSVTHAWTPSSRTMRVPSGARAFQARFGKSLSQIVRVEAAEGTRVALRLLPSADVTARVTWAPGGPDPESVSFLARFADEPDVTISGELADDRASATFSRLRCGKWTFEAHVGDGVPLASVETDVGEKGAEILLPVRAWGPSDGFRILVFDVNGAAADNASVDVSGEGDSDCEVVDAGEGVWFLLRLSEPSKDKLHVVASTDSAHVTADVEHDRTEDLVLRMPERFELTLVVPPGTDNVTLVPLDGGDGGDDSWSDSPDEDGTITFGGLPAGRYEVRTDDEQGGGAMIVRVPSAGRVQLRIERFRALRVTDVEEESAAAGWGLRAGDEIVGIDGEEFRDALHMDALQAAAAMRGEATLDVVRNGRRLRIECDMRAVRRGYAGVEWEPALRN